MRFFTKKEEQGRKTSPVSDAVRYSVAHCSFAACSSSPMTPIT